MCRYAMHAYKDHFACFACCKMFRPALWEDMVHPTGREQERRISCPECRGPLYDMGKDFKAPRQSDRRQWRIMATLFQNGITFHSCGCGGAGYRPTTLRELAAFIEEKTPADRVKARWRNKGSVRRGKQK